LERPEIECQIVFGRNFRLVIIWYPSFVELFIHLRLAQLSTFYFTCPKEGVHLVFVGLFRQDNSPDKYTLFGIRSYYLVLFRACFLGVNKGVVFYFSSKSFLCVNNVVERPE